jgi:hypothetical protein
METQQIIDRLLKVVASLRGTPIDKAIIRDIEYVIEDLMLYRHTNIYIILNTYINIYIYIGL